MNTDDSSVDSGDIKTKSSICQITNKDAMNYIAKLKIFMINESPKNLGLIEELRNAVINERKSRKPKITDYFCK